MLQQDLTELIRMRVNSSISPLRGLVCYKNHALKLLLYPLHVSATRINSSLTIVAVRHFIFVLCDYPCLGILQAELVPTGTNQNAITVCVHYFQVCRVEPKREKRFHQSDPVALADSTIASSHELQATKNFRLGRRRY